MTWLLTTAAYAATGHLALDVSPDTTVEVYPRTVANRIDIAVDGNRMPLHDQLANMSSRHLMQADAVSIGGGRWFLSLFVESPTIGVTPNLAENRLLLQLHERSDEPLLDMSESATLSQLLADEPKRLPAAPSALPLHPLMGDATTIAIPSQQFLAGLPVWTVADVMVPSLHGWPAVDLYSHQLALADEPDVRTASRYALGLAYMNIDLYREASYYLESALHDDPQNAVAEIALAAAHAHVVTGAPHDARVDCALASRLGASERDTLACLGAAALLDGAPSPTHLANALERASDAIPDRLLAAQLYLLDHRHDQARRLLLPHSDSVNPWLLATLGDAHFFAGDIPRAAEMWEVAMEEPQLQALMALRIGMSNLVLDGPATWAPSIPSLIDAQKGPRAVRAEAAYLAAQIATEHGDPDLAADQLNRAWNSDRARIRRSDVPERLIATCDKRMAMLQRSGRAADQVSFFTGCWRPELDRMAAHPHVLQQAAKQLHAMGLHEDALELQTRAMTVFTRLGLDDVDALLLLVELHLATDRSQAALDAVAYIQQLPASDVEPGRLHALQAQAHEAQGRLDEAIASWTEAEASSHPSATERRGLLRADQRDWASALNDLADAESDAGMLARSRALLGSANPSAVLAQSNDGFSDPGMQKEATWMQGVAATQVGSGPATGVWQEVLEELDQLDVLQQELTRRDN